MTKRNAYLGIPLPQLQIPADNAPSRRDAKRIKREQWPEDDAHVATDVAAPILLAQADVRALIDVTDVPSWKLPVGASPTTTPLTTGEPQPPSSVAQAVPAAAAPAASTGLGWGWYAAGGLGLAAAAGGGGSGGGGSSAPAGTTLTGTIVAGPLVAGHGLTVTAYQANGTTVLGSSGAVSSDGSYSINIGSYTGVVILKVSDNTPTADYRDEGTNANKDLNAELAVAGVVSTAGGTVTLHITPLTTVAVLKLPANPVALDVTSTNNGVANAFSLNGIDLTVTLPVTVFDVAYDPASLSNGERYGALLASVSGMDVANGNNTQTTLNQIATGLSGSTLNTTVTQALATGTTVADNALPTDLTTTVSSIQPAIDTQAPTLVITDNVANTANGPVTYTFAFSEPVTGFSTNSVNVTGGTKGTFTGSGTTYTLVVTPPTSGNGTINVSVNAGVAFDAANNGNTAAIAASQPYDNTAADTTAPTVTITDNVTGTANGDITFTFTFSEVVTGFTAAGVSLSAGSKGAFAGSGTTYTLVVTPPATGSGSITVGVASGVAADGAGNGNLAASSLTQPYDRGTTDTTAPTAPTINTVATDDIINASEQTASITGTAEANSTISLSIGGNTRTIAADASGNWAYSLISADIAAMGQGSETLSATARDAAGNTSSAGTKAISVDTATPNAPTINTVATDDVINTNETTASITGTAEANSTISLSIGGNTRNVSADASGNWTYALIAADLTAMGQGAETLSATAQDAAGNVGTAGTRNITVDTVAPTAPTINAVATDNFINAIETGVPITGTAEASATISLSLGGNTRTVTADGNGGWAYTLVSADIIAMGQGAETLSATATDAAGNVSTATQRNITVDTGIPSAPAINSVATDNIINAAETGASITGTAEANSTISLTIGGNTRTVTADASGNWSYALIPVDFIGMGEGTETLSATSRDAAGNVSFPGALKGRFWPPGAHSTISLRSS